MDFLDVPLSGVGGRLGTEEEEGSSRAVEFAGRLQRLLTLHDQVVLQIADIDAYITKTKNSAIRAMIHGHKGRVLHYMGCTSVANGIKAIFQEYRVQKWYQVQLLASHIMRSLDPSGASPTFVIPDHVTGDEGQQVKKFSRTMMVSFCNFSRFN